MMHRFARLLKRDRRGTMVIETAIVTPVLLMLSLGAYDISRMVAKQAELDNAAEQASAIALASSPDTDAKRTTLQQIIVATTGLASGSVTVTAAYRCNTSANFVTNSATCTTGVRSNFVKIYMTTTLSPTWTQFGVGHPITYRVTRYAMYSQSDVP